MSDGIGGGASAAALLLAAIATGCSNGHRAGAAAEVSNTSSTDRGTDRAGTLSVTVFRISGWHDGSYHYVPTLLVTVPSTARAVLVRRVDFTADDAGVRRLLRGVRYVAERRVQPGDAVVLVSDAGRVATAVKDERIYLGHIRDAIHDIDELHVGGPRRAHGRMDAPGCRHSQLEINGEAVKQLSRSQGESPGDP